MSLGPYLHSMWNISASHFISFYWGISRKGNKPWIFIGRADAEAEGSVLWPPDVKSQLIGKEPDAGKDWRHEEMGTTEDEMVGWYHRLNGHESEWTPEVGEEQGSLVCCSPWGCKESDTTERLYWTETELMYSFMAASSLSCNPQDLWSGTRASL